MKKSIFRKAGSLLVACAVFVGLVGCTDKKQSGPDSGNEVENLVNQIKLDDVLVDINTVIYEKDGDEWTFWLTPRKDLSLVSEVEKEDDYLKVTVTSPKGTVDVSKEDFYIRYKGVTVSGKTMVDFSKVELQADALENDGKITLNLYTLVENRAGSRLVARYNGDIAESGLEPLQTNTWRIGRETWQILSVVKNVRCNSEFKIDSDNFTRTTDYYFYSEAGKTGPADGSETANYIKVSMSSDLKGVSHDLSTVDRDKLKIVCGDLDLMSSVTEGTLRFSAKGNSVQMQLNAKFGEGGNVFEADCDTEEAVVCYESDNRLVLTEPLGSEEITLEKVYKKKDSYVLAFGLKENPDDMAGLMDEEARYAVEISLDASDVTNGNIIRLDEANKTAAGVTVYDYKEYRTVKFDEMLSAGAFQGKGAVYAEENDGRIYLYMDVYFGPGEPSVKVNWYGTVTEQDPWVDLTPVRPAKPNFFSKTAKDATEPGFYKEITEVRFKKEDTKRIMGTTIPVYTFYFINESTYPDEFDDIITTPCLNVNQTYANGVEKPFQTNKNSSSPDDFVFMLNYTNRDAALVGSGRQLTNSWQYMDGADNGSLTVKDNGDGTWAISFSMVNEKLSWGSPSSDSDGGTFVISYEGPVTPL